MVQPALLDQKIWCPLCNDYARFLRIGKAAALADVSPRTIYRYLEQGKVYSVKVAGKTTRICLSCLLKPDLI